MTSNTIARDYSPELIAWVYWGHLVVSPVLIIVSGVLCVALFSL